MTQAIIALASEYGRYGYRRITALLQARERRLADFGSGRHPLCALAPTQNPQHLAQAPSSDLQDVTGN